MLFIAGLLILGGCTAKEPARNPDPNHTHVNFAVWIEGKQLDFSLPQYMSDSLTEGKHADQLADHLHDYLHLHDGNGHVIHRHKPGLALTDFFSSMAGMRYEGNMFKFLDCMTCQHAAGSYAVKLYVNGNEVPQGSAYVFTDNDKVLITDATDPMELRKEIRMMTDDACLYSRTCPERGEPPTENCIADPEVPCVVR